MDCNRDLQLHTIQHKKFVLRSTRPDSSLTIRTSLVLEMPLDIVLGDWAHLRV